MSGLLRARNAAKWGWIVPADHARGVRFLPRVWLMVVLNLVLRRLGLELMYPVAVQDRVHRELGRQRSYKAWLHVEALPAARCRRRTQSRAPGPACTRLQSKPSSLHSVGWSWRLELKWYERKILLDWLELELVAGVV